MSEGEPRSMQRRGTLVLLALVCLGLPMIVMSQLVSRRYLGPVTSGDQPGGTIAGQLVDGDGQPAQESPVQVYAIGSDGAREELTTTRSDSAGEFQVDVSPITGHYVVVAGGEVFQRVARPVSFLSKKGEHVTPEPIRIELPPGCALAITFEREDGRKVTGGTLYVEGRVPSDFLFGLLPAQIRLDRPFEGASVRVDGLPPITGDVRVELGSGERVDFKIELEEGELTRHFVL